MSTALAGRTLKVEVAGDWAPFAYECTAERVADKSDACASGDLAFAGLHGEFMQRIADAAGFDIEWRLGPTPASYAESRAQGTWSWDACVIDVQKGLADVCVQYMWETSARRSRTQFSAYFEMDQGVMYIRNPETDTSQFERATAIFDPFTPELWGLIFLVSVVVGLLYTLLDDGVDVRRQLANGHKAVVAKSVASSMYRRLFDLWSAAHGGDYDSENIKQRIIVASPAPLARRAVRPRGRRSCPGRSSSPSSSRPTPRTWRSVAASRDYRSVARASRAYPQAFLGTREIAIDPASIDECISDGCAFCTSGYSQTVDALERVFPQLSRTDCAGPDAPAACANNVAIWNHLEDYGCDASVEYTTSLRFDPGAFDNGKAECDVKVMGSPLYSFPIAWPVGADIAESISYWIRYLIDEESVWIELSDKYTPPSGCDYDLSLADAAEESLDTESLTASQFIGPLLIIAAAAVVALALHLTAPVARKAGQRASVALHLSPAPSACEDLAEREPEKRRESPKALTAAPMRDEAAFSYEREVSELATTPEPSRFAGWSCGFDDAPESPSALPAGDTAPTPTWPSSIIG